MTFAKIFAYVWDMKNKHIEKIQVYSSPLKKIHEKFLAKKEGRKKTMKKIILVALVVISCAKGVRGSEFKFIDVNHPRIVTGVFSDLKGHSDAGASLALITYSGPVQFTPCAIGGTLGAGLGGPSLAIGTSINLLPEVKAGIRSIINALWPATDKFSNVKAILDPPIAGTLDLTFSVGPHFSLVAYDGLKTKGIWTLFTGAAWKF